MPTNPAIAMGSFSPSDILSVSVWKNSSGSVSRVRALRSGSPMSMNNVVVVGGELGWLEEEIDLVRLEVWVGLAVNAVATVATKRRVRRDRIMMSFACGC